MIWGRFSLPGIHDLPTDGRELLHSPANLKILFYVKYQPFFFYMCPWQYLTHDDLFNEMYPRH